MDPNKAPTQAVRVLARLMETPGEWVPMPELAAVSGAFAVHSRISELRHPGGHVIEHRQKPIPCTTQRASFYRWMPPAE